MSFNYRKVPIKTKYFDEDARLERWFIWGVHDDNTVDIAGSASGDDIFVNVPFAVAEDILVERDRFLASIKDLMRSPDA